MRGMLWMDLKRMRWWVVLGGILAVGRYFEINDSYYTGIMLMQAYAILMVRQLIQEDRVCQWERTTAMFPMGRKRYGTEKILFLLTIWLVYVAGWQLGRILYWTENYFLLDRTTDFTKSLPGTWPGYLWHFLKPDTLFDIFQLPGGSYGAVWLLGMTALQLPVVLYGKTIVWEVVTWLLGYCGVLWLRTGYNRAVRVALHTESFDPDALPELEYFHFYDAPWELLAWIALAMFLVSAVCCILLAEKQKEPFVSRKRLAVEQKLQGLQKPILAILSVGLVLGIGIEIWQTANPVYRMYVYRKPDLLDEETFEYTVAYEEPSEMSGDWTLVSTYETKNRRLHYNPLNEIGGQVLLWDDGWLLYHAETEEITKLNIDVSPYNADGTYGYNYIQMFGDTEPLMINVCEYQQWENTGYFSIRENRMITDYCYPRAKYYDAENGCIVTEPLQISKRPGTKTYYTIDVYTGEVTEVIEEKQ